MLGVYFFNSFINFLGKLFIENIHAHGYVWLLGDIKSYFFRNSTLFSPSQVRKAKIAYGVLFTVLLISWSAILIGLSNILPDVGPLDVFFRLGVHFPRKQSQLRDVPSPGHVSVGIRNYFLTKKRPSRVTTPAWGGEATEECSKRGWL